ncbi:MAG: serine/threonine-protein kinase, partial [Nannocystaceae bacterium]|nr:serine/threonine-protein kinase [Nannocystaceae bacterium]
MLLAAHAACEHGRTGSDTPHDPDDTLADAARRTLAAGARDDADAGARLAAALVQRMMGAAEPARIGRYHVGALLGRGGAGAVHRAWDPELDREVAIKRVHLRGNAQEVHASEVRLLREARALAQIDHRAVVRVLDVGSHDGPRGREVYVVMELLPGINLAQWSRTRPRWPAVVDAMAQAASGLAAAHARGLVHRDFKPGNAIIDPHGRVTVIDFGLAIGQGTAVGSEPGDATPADDGATATGVVMGTPPYMAPEQHEAGAIDHRCDQFALAVTLCELLFDRRPFPQRELVRLVAAKRAGRFELPRAGGVPARLLAILARGLQPDPAQRFADMAQLAAALRASLPRRGRARAITLAAAAVAASAIATGMLARSQAPACAERVAALQGFEPDDAAAIERAFAATGLDYAQGAAPRTIAALEDQSRRIVDVARELCDGGRIDPDAHACLQTRRAELVALRDALIAADAELAARAVGATAALGDPRGCDRVAGPRHDDATLQALAAIEALERLGRETAALERTVALLQQPAVVHDPVLHARVLAVQGRLQLQSGDPRSGEAATEQAALAAAAAGDDEVAARAWFTLAHHRARQGDVEAAELALRNGHAAMSAWRGTGDRSSESTVSDAATIALARLDGTARTAIALARGEWAAALEAALQLRADTLVLYDEGDVHVIEADNTVAVVLRRAGRPDDSIEVLQQAIAALRATAGDDHPDLAILHGNLGAALLERGRGEQALAADLAALAVLDANGERSSLRRAAIEAHTAGALHRLARDEAAVTHGRAALEMLAALGQLDGNTATVARNNLAMALSKTGERDGAIEQLRAALATHLRLDPRGRSVPLAHGNLARELAAAGRHEEAREQGQTAVARAREIFGARSLESATAQVALGDVLHETGDATAAITAYAAALALREELGAPLHQRARVQLELARARVDAGAAPGV